MSKSIYEFWLSIDNGAEKLRLPVLPSVLEIGNSSQNDSIDIAKLGEVTIIQDPAAKTFHFSSFFPVNESSLTEYAGFPKPWDCVKTIDKWKNSGKPIRFIVTGTPINFAATIEDFPYREGDSDIGEINYNLSLKEYQFTAVRKITVAKPAPPPKPRPDPKPKPKTHTVKRGDTLWALARKYYKNGAQWKKIWSVKSNKDMLIKRDKRNVKQPGHWIYPGQKLVIPT